MFLDQVKDQGADGDQGKEFQPDGRFEPLGRKEEGTVKHLHTYGINQQPQNGEIVKPEQCFVLFSEVDPGKKEERQQDQVIGQAKGWWYEVVGQPEIDDLKKAGIAEVSAGKLFFEKKQPHSRSQEVNGNTPVLPQLVDRKSRLYLPDQQNTGKDQK